MVTFSDETFNDADWEIYRLGSIGGASHTAGQDATPGLGNPSPYRRMANIFGPGSDADPSSVVASHRFLGGRYDPRIEGPVGSIDMSMDRIVFNPGRVGHTFFVVQNDVIYHVNEDIDERAFEGETWETRALTDLTAEDFSTTPGAHPDFPRNGSALTFGFGRSNTTRSNQTLTFEHGIDNWLVTIVPADVPFCRILPRNTYLPTHVFETHILNPARHPPHDGTIAVVFDGAPAPAGVDISLLATRPVFFDSSGMPTLPMVTLQTDGDGQAAFEYVPPSAKPLDRTDFEASGSFNGMSFKCEGSVVAGMGSLTTLLQTLTQGSLAPELGLWDKVLARVAPGRDSTSLSSDEIVEILLNDRELLRSLRESVSKYPPLLQATAIARAVGLRESALNKIAAVLEHFEAYADSKERGSIRQVREYLGDRDVLAGFVPDEGKNGSGKVAFERAQLRAGHDRLPPLFEANRGQAAEPVQYLARGPGYQLYLTPQEAVLATGPVSGRAPASTTVLRMGFVEAHPNPKVLGLEQQSAKSHYLIGNDPAQWHVNVPHYARVKYEEIYPGVDLVYYANHGRLEYDLIVAPGASPDPIVLAFQGVQRPKLNSQGDLILDTTWDQFQLKKPVIYQDIDGVRQSVAGGYRLEEGNRVGFDLGPYNSSQPLVIDPILAYSSYVGGGDHDATGSIAVGPDGGAYVTGSTASVNFPAENPLQSNSAGGDPISADVFVTKLAPDGSGLVYSTYVGGSGMDAGLAIAVDKEGNAYVTGSTGSQDFPMTGAGKSALTEALSSPTAEPIEPNVAIRVAMRRRALTERLNFWQWGYYYQQITGRSQPDPFQYLRPKPGEGDWTVGEIKNYQITADQWWELVTAPPPAQPKGQASAMGARSAFVMKLNPTGSGLTYSTYLGGSGNDNATAIALDTETNAYVVGTTTSMDFPVTDAFQATHGGGSRPFDPLDAFVAKLNAEGTEVVYATYLGGSGDDVARGVAVDSGGSAHVTGGTLSQDFPVTGNALQTEPSGHFDAFVTQFDAAGSALTYSTYLGGESSDLAFGIALDGEDNRYVTGITGSADFPLFNPMQSELGTDDLLGFDAFVTKLNADGSALEYSTFLGGSGMEIGFGIAVNSDGNAFVAGETDSVDFPTVSPIQAFQGGLSDGFVVSLGPTGSVLEFSTYLGGSNDDSALAIALDGMGGALVTGPSLSIDSPATVGAFQTSSAGPTDALVVKIVEGEPPPAVATILAASGSLLVAPGSIASGFGDPLAPGTEAAAALPLPTEILGVSVRVTDSAGAQRLSQLFVVTPGQINFFLDPATALGLALIEVLQDGGVIATGTVQVVAVAPGIFTANADGQGAPAALYLRFRGAEQTAQEFVFDTTAPLGARGPLLIDFGGEDEQVFIAIFGTGMRGGSEITATLDGEPVPVSPVVALEGFVGLDQANVGSIPRSFIGRGVVELRLFIDGMPSNAVFLLL